MGDLADQLAELCEKLDIDCEEDATDDLAEKELEQLPGQRSHKYIYTTALHKRRLYM